MPTGPQSDSRLPPTLDPASIRRLLLDPKLPFEIESSVDSTNNRLARHLDRGQLLRVLLAEHQSAGRGRHGRQWLSPPGRGLYLSMAWDFTTRARALSALALVAGLAVADSIARHSNIQLGLKWPNDLQVRGNKLGGCLIDLRQTGMQRCLAIIGIGINVDLGSTAGPDQPWTDLVREGGCNDRNRLAAMLINALERDLALFEQRGFAVFQTRWKNHDVLRGRRLRLSGNGTDLEGLGRGVDASGALLLETSTGVHAIRAGEVSVRHLNRDRQAPDQGAMGPR